MGPRAKVVSHKKGAAKAKSKSKVKHGSEPKEKKESEKEPVFNTDYEIKAKFQELMPTEDMKKDWRLFSRTYAEWYRQSAAESMKVHSFLKALTPEQKELVYNMVPEGIDTCDSIFEVLKETYGSDLYLQNKSDIAAYRRHDREEHESLDEFLKTRQQLRVRSLAAGMPSDAADGFVLLDACRLSESQNIQITRDIQLRLSLSGKTEGTLPTYNEMLTELRLITKVKENMKLVRGFGKSEKTKVLVAKVIKKEKKKKSHHQPFEKKYKALVAQMEKKFISDWICGACGASVFGSRDSCFKCGVKKTGTEATTTISSKGKGKGKGGKGKGGAGRSSKPCLNFAKDGTCKHEKNCWFSHSTNSAAVGSGV